MLLERTLHQLDIGPVPPEQAREMAQLGYMQWLGALPGRADYRRAAQEAHQAACPFAQTSPAVAEFCILLRASLDMPPRPLPLKLPARVRRGGAQARRLSI